MTAEYSARPPVSYSGAASEAAAAAAPAASAAAVHGRPAQEDAGDSGLLPGRAWFENRQPGAVQPPGNAALQGLRLLGFLRVFAPLSQLLTMIVVTQHYQVHVPSDALAVLLGAQALVAIATWFRLRHASHVSSLELFLQVHIDILLFTAVLYYTGGATNPFAPLFVLPLAIAASALTPRWGWATAATTMLAYAFLRSNHISLYHPEGLTEVYQLHEDGMLVNYLFTAALLAYFIHRMQSALRRHERKLAEARDAQMRSESVVSIGALAAGYAHELSSPLATMAVVVAELKREHAGNTALVHDLQVIDDQIAATKQIVSNLTSAGGRRRAESVGGARADQFVAAIVSRARALHPGATIVTLLDDRTPPPLVATEETLRQAITNLVDNAVHASPNHVEIRADWSGADLVIAVRDHGPGFSPDLLARVGRERETTKGPDGGMGLGLMLSVATLELLGGSLELANMPDGGARAVVRVPLRAIQIDLKRNPGDGRPDS